MLVLERAEGEAIYIDCPDGSRITVRLQDINPRGRNVHLAIDAPRNYQIVRDDAHVTTPKGYG